MHNINYDSVSVSVEVVEKAVGQLKFGTAAGFDNITAKHIVYAHPVLLSCLSTLFNLMFRLNYVPDDFGLGIMVPLL